MKNKDCNTPLPKYNPKTGIQIWDSPTNLFNNLRAFVVNSGQTHDHGYNDVVDKLDHILSSLDYSPLAVATYDFSEANFFDIHKYFIVYDDLISYLRDNHAKLIFVSTEGEHKKTCRYPEILQHTIDHYSLDQSQICMISGSHYPSCEYKLAVHFLPMLWLETHSTNTYYYSSEFDRRSILEVSFDNKHYFSAMSKNRRPWRLWAMYHLLQSVHSERGLIAISGQNGGGGSGLPETYADVEKFMQGRLMVFETGDFNPLQGSFQHFNFRVSPVAHNSVLFHINMETHQNDNECVFYTEKTAKALIAEVPFLTWGEAGMNTRHFEDLGFVPYTDWFDMSFDYVKDPEQRWYQLQSEIERVCAELNAMNPSQQIDWSLKNRDVLVHNKQQMLKVCCEQISKFCDSLIADL